MKNLFKSTVVLFILSFSVAEGIAQDKPEKPKKNFFGIVAGASVSTLTNYDGKPLSSFTGGLLWIGGFPKSLHYSQ